MSVWEYAEMMAAARKRAVELSKQGKHCEACQMVMLSSYVTPPLQQMARFGL